MRTRFFSLTLPAAADLREGFCLLLLAAAMVFSVLNIGVHRLAERTWEPISHGLSPDGREYVSISLAGLRVHDVETGREIQRKSWRSPWSEQPMNFMGQFDDTVYHLQDRDESAKFADHGGMETQPTTVISSSKRFVIGMFPGGCALWWDRREDRVRVACFPDHLLLRCFIDETRDRYLLECVRYPKVYLQRPQDPPPELPEPPSLLGRAIDVIEFGLSSGEELERHFNLRVGAPVDHDFRTRLVAAPNGASPRLERWTEFPRGTPEKTPLVDCYGLENIGIKDQCSIRLNGGGVVIDEENSRIALTPLAFESEAARSALIFRSMNYLDWKHSGGALEGGLCNWYDRDLLGVEQADHSNEFRVCDIELTQRLCGVTATNGDSQPIYRAADEMGRVYELPASQSGLPIYRQMHLQPYPRAFALSLGAFLAGLASWTIHATRDGALLASRGWAVLFVAALWPLVLWGFDLGLDDGGVAVICRLILLVACGLLLGLMAVLLVSKGSGARPLSLALAIGVALYCVCAWGGYFSAPYSI